MVATVNVVNYTGMLGPVPQIRIYFYHLPTTRISNCILNTYSYTTDKCRPYQLIEELNCTGNEGYYRYPQLGKFQ